MEKIAEFVAALEQQGLMLGIVPAESLTTRPTWRAGGMTRTGVRTGGNGGGTASPVIPLVKTFLNAEKTATFGKILDYVTGQGVNINATALRNVLTRQVAQHVLATRGKRNARKYFLPTTT